MAGHDVALALDDITVTFSARGAGTQPYTAVSNTTLRIGAGAAGTAFGANITLPTAGQFVTYPALTPNGVFCTIVSGTADLTFFVIE